ncbi:hypothetical protein J8F10_16110 [Gemmata sp. G18]|uniref:Uncharacterized protein n=1 Tax=Gemmata palustris TaxID=2822762 RepID=A0ABS5BSW7_9BACT|nr:hypothetical protein [Gemmata palustris]MBP3956798.1 hypothetical protein [Gemmata palustris]
MGRSCVFALLAVAAATSGCASHAKFIEKKADSGIVAVPDETDAWPNNNRRAALDLIQKHVGPNFEILDERTVSTGRTARNSLPDTNEALNPRNQAYPAKRPISATATQQEGTEYRITYRKLGSDPNPGAPGTTVQTQYPSAGVQQAGGTGAGGPLSVFNRNPVQPAGGADCDH